MYATVGTVVLVGLRSDSTRTTDNHLKRIISTNCCILTAVPPDVGPSIRPKHLEVDEI